MFRQSGEWVTILKNKKKRNPFHNLRTTVFLSFFLFALIVVPVYSFLILRSYNLRSIDEKLTQVQNQCSILGNQILVNQFTIDSSKDNLNVEIDQLANLWEGRILVIDQTYHIVKDTFTIDQDNYIIYDEVMEVMHGDKDKNIRMLDDYAEIIVPIVNSDKVINGVMIATVSLSDVIDMNEYIRARAGVIVALFLVIAFAIALIASVLSVNDIIKMKAGVDDLVSGQAQELRADCRSNEMNDLKNSMSELLDKMQVLEASRQEFVSNVSHELKTPITSMKVLADSLLMQEDVPAEMYREFMQDMVDEIDRENKIINDLLTLVKMDKKSAELNIEKININALLELLLKRIKPIAAKRNIEVVFESFRDVVAEVDEVKLSLALSNLIENAVKYNNDGGWVHVSLNADHKTFYVQIQDNGVGIPEDAQSKIFERFYRVDKARSRETGGTGLGLAITRQSILMHKGAIKIHSVPGEGTMFTIRVPLKYVK